MFPDLGRPGETEARGGRGSAHQIIVLLLVLLLPLGGRRLGGRRGLRGRGGGGPAVGVLGRRHGWIARGFVRRRSRRC